MISFQSRWTMVSTSAVRRATAVRPSPIAENSCSMAADSRTYRSHNSLRTVATVVISMTLSPNYLAPAPAFIPLCSETSQQQGDPGVLVERVVIGARPPHRKQLSHCTRVHIGVLPQ